MRCAELLKAEDMKTHVCAIFFRICTKFRLLSAKLVKQAFSKHRPSGPMLSISRNVRLSVCMFVRLFVCSPLRYRLTVFLPPLPEVRCPIFLEIRNPWGKVMERSRAIFLLLLILPYKTWWKPRFPMD